MKISPELIPHGIFADILLLIFSFRFLQYDPIMEEISPFKQLGSVNSEWRRLVRSYDLQEAIASSPGVCFQKLRFGLNQISGVEHLPMLQKALELKSLTAIDMSPLFAKCSDHLTIQTVASKLTNFQGLPTSETDLAIGQTLMHYNECCIESGETNIMSGLSEYFRSHGIISSVWSIFSGSLDQPFDFSNHDGAAEVCRTFFQSSQFNTEQCIRFPLPLLAKLFIIENISEESSSGLYQSIAIEIIRRYWKKNQPEKFVKFMEFFDSITLRSGIPISAHIIFVPLAYAALSDLGSFFQFIISTNYDLQDLINRLEKAGLESNMVDYLNLASAFRLILRLLRGDATANPASLCFMPSIKELVGYERIVFRFNFNIAQFRQVLTDAQDMGLSRSQTKLNEDVFDAAYFPFRFYF